MSDITVVKRLLTDRAQGVAEHLLPQGRKEGAEWRVGSVQGEPGQSLGVHLSGEKIGIWHDFATDEGGDLIDLWRAVKRLSLPEALDEARGWLGLERPEPTRDPRREYARPERPECRRPEARVRDYLVEDRNIPGEILERYAVGERDDLIVFPFLLPDGILAMAKVRQAADGGKTKPTAKDCEPVLFGWQAVPEDAREVAITEGEIDALSMAAYGFPAVSVPYGGGGGDKQRWIESEFERMERFERIYLATDMDEAGDQAAEAIAARLGRHRCFRVSLPRKDANECLVDGVSKDEITAAVKGARSLDPEGLKRAGDYTAEVIRLFWPQPEDHPGYATPYAKLGGDLRFRDGEVTLWSGMSGAGKSQILSDCVVDWIAQGSRVCLSSLEMKPGQTLKRMVKQVVGVDRPTEEYIHRAIAYLDRGLILYERVGKAGIDALLEVFDYARARYGCDQFAIDSLMRLGIESDDWNGQEKAMFRLVDWSLKHNVHVHLVAHTRKAEKGHGVGEVEDVKGASEIGANASNILIVWRNRMVEEALRRGEQEDRPGVVLNVAKQRNGDFEGRTGLWFDQASYRYRSSRDSAITGRQYLSDESLPMEAAS